MIADGVFSGHSRSGRPNRHVGATIIAALMRLAAIAVPYVLLLSGSVYLGAILFMSQFGARLGSSRFFLVAAIAASAYAVM